MSDPLDFLRAADIPALRQRAEALRDERAASQKRFTAEIEAIETLIRAAQLLASPPAKRCEVAKAIEDYMASPEEVSLADIQLPPITPPLTETETRLAKSLADFKPDGRVASADGIRLIDKIVTHLQQAGPSKTGAIARNLGVATSSIAAALRGNKHLVENPQYGIWRIRAATSEPINYSDQYLPDNQLPYQSPANRAEDYLAMTMAPASAMAIGQAIGMNQPSDMAAILATDERFSKGKNGFWTLATPPAEWKD